MKCVIEDCDREGKRRNMCTTHYMRWWTHGDPTFSKYASHGEPLRFLHENVLLYKGDECLPWPHACSSTGYGVVFIDGKNCNVHAVVCEKINGPRPSLDHVASHKCGNGHLGCCNPGHLEWQTRIEDCADRVTHGTAARGSKNSRSILNEESVREIRSLKGKMSQDDIAKKFGVTKNVISQVMTRKSWAWLE